MQMNRESPKGLVTELRGRNGVTEMKVKHFLSGATLLSAALLLNAPLSAAVESDVVGYTTIEMQAGTWYLLGNPFIALDGTASFKLNDVYVGEGLHTGDLLYVLNGNTFSPRYWNEGEEKWSTNSLFFIDDLTEYSASTAVYLKKMSAGNLTFTGKVSPVRIEVGTEDGNAWSLTALTYPKVSTLDEYTWEGFQPNDMLYTTAKDGSLVPHYWNSTSQSWSTNELFPVSDNTPLSIGQAVYLLKKSAGTGTISKE